MWKKLTFDTLGPLSNENSFRSSDFIALAQDWQSIVGKTLSENSLPFKMMQKTLFILTKHPVISEELNFKQISILSEIRKKYPALGKKIQKLTFQYNELSFLKEQNHLNLKPKLKMGLHPYSPEYLRLKEEAKNFFNENLDEEMQLIWTSLYIQMMSNN